MYKSKAEVIDERTLKLSKPIKYRGEITVIIKQRELFRNEINVPAELIDEVVENEYDFVGD